MGIINKDGDYVKAFVSDNTINPNSDIYKEFESNIKIEATLVCPS